MPNTRKYLPTLLSLPLAALTACQTLAPVPPDPQVAQLAQSLEREAGAFFAALADKPAPDCDFAHNAPVYDELAAITGRLEEHLASSNSGKPLHHAAQALSRTVAEARSSHERASATVTDQAGACLASGALALNANAIARASRAIAATQTNPGEQ